MSFGRRQLCAEEHGGERHHDARREGEEHDPWIPHLRREAEPERDHIDRHDPSEGSDLFRIHMLILSSPKWCRTSSQLVRDKLRACPTHHSLTFPNGSRLYP